MRTRQKLGLALATSIALALSACGGGGDAPAASVADADAVPSAAGTSTQSFVDYQKGLQTSDVIEPLTLQQFLPPLDDTAEPFPIG